jgi:hypothetical protein
MEIQRFSSDLAKVEVRSYSSGEFHVWPYATVLSDLVGDSTGTKACLDIFWKHGGNFQMAATFNPDFGQVESDDLVIDFSADFPRPLAHASPFQPACCFSCRPDSRKKHTGNYDNRLITGPIRLVRQGQAAERGDNADHWCKEQNGGNAPCEQEGRGRGRHEIAEHEKDAAAFRCRRHDQPEEKEECQLPESAGYAHDPGGLRIEECKKNWAYESQREN